MHAVERLGEPGDERLRRHDLVHRVGPTAGDGDGDAQDVVARRVDVLGGGPGRIPGHLGVGPQQRSAARGEDPGAKPDLVAFNESSSSDFVKEYGPGTP